MLEFHYLTASPSFKTFQLTFPYQQVFVTKWDQMGQNGTKWDQMGPRDKFFLPMTMKAPVRPTPALQCVIIGPASGGFMVFILRKN